jgi:hypothetical protein
VRLHFLELWNSRILQYGERHVHGGLVERSHGLPLAAHLINVHSCHLQALPQDEAEPSSPLAVRLERDPRSFHHLHIIVKG